MKKLLQASVIAVAMLMGSVSGALADYEAGKKAFDASDFETAMKEWKPLAAQGHARAQHGVGFMYATGRGVAQEYKEAVKWYRKAAEQGYAKAQYNLGFMYANGKGVRKNNNEAEKWYHMAAGQIYGKAYGGSGYLFKLHSSYRDLSVSQVQSIPNISIRKKDEWGFYGHSTIIHSYNSKSINGDKVVIDNATGLMWHQNGSYNYFLEYKMAEKWLKKLNKRGYAGYSDWKFPTVEEASSLLESYKKNGGLYIDPVFSNKQGSIYTGDKENGSAAAWRVRFSYGSVYLYNFNHYDYVRPVRSGK